MFKFNNMNAKGLFYHFLRNYSNLKMGRDDITLCDVVKQTFVGFACICSIVVLAVIFIASIVVTPIHAWCIYILKNPLDNGMLISLGVVGLALWIAAILGLGVCCYTLIYQKIHEYNKRRRFDRSISNHKKPWVRHTPNLFIVAWDSFKSKTCFFINIEDWEYKDEVSHTDYSD